MPTPGLAPITPYLGMAGIAWLYYRRIRRNFGRQPWRRTRTVVRLAIVAVVASLLLFAAAFLPHVAVGMAAGAAAGAALGLLSLRHTHAEWSGGSGYYTPNPWIGGALSVLLVARLAWRGWSGAFSGGTAQSMQQASPLTMSLAAALIAYSLVYNIGLLLRMRGLQAGAAMKPADVGG
jgi:ABC-type dipeptide/oligopeptide/nickel transport system permease component